MIATTASKRRRPQILCQVRSHCDGNEFVVEVLHRIKTDILELSLEAKNIKLDRPYSVNDSGVGIAFITDPWGAYIEINERPGQ